MNPFAILISVLFIPCLNLITASSILDHDQGTNVDRLALLAIKSKISNDPQGVLNSWNDSLHYCRWKGVTCGAKLHQQRRVVALNFTSKALSGTLSPFVGNLSFLHHLFLFNNTFHGHIPPQISHLLKLQSLVLEKNSFEGEIPANISRCLNLKLLGLNSNHLSGTIPPELGLLSNMVKLTLYENSFTGNLLNTVVMNMTSLEILDASTNSFQGNIPHNIGQCKKLSFFALAQNKISGTLPLSFCNLSSLEAIDLQFNQIYGTLPPNIGFCFPHLSHLRISGNFFHGRVPLSLSNLTHLEDLVIYSNNFTGRFMFNARNLPNFAELDISLNHLGTGEVDDLSFLQTLSNCSQLYILECGSNNFGGILPHFLGNLTTELESIDFQLNQITGTIPSGLFNLVNLNTLQLSNNQLTGYLPPEIGKLTMLEQLSCSSNNLIGNIPNLMGNLSKLSTLSLDDNNFEGIVPSSLGDCENLLYLSLSKNNLGGALPSYIFHASMLVELNLGHNHLQGSIPVEIGQLRNLVEFNATGNSFSGEIPGNLGSCRGLVKLDMGRNFFNGSIPQPLKSLTSLQYLNLSYNKLSGQIPEFLSIFPLMRLDLSFNNLEGQVPRKGVFSNLSAVSVSGNSKLCGGIPELHLTKCMASDPTRGFQRGRKFSLLVILIITMACLVVGISLVSSIYLICSRRKRINLSRGSPMRDPFSKVSYDMLLKATDGFSQGNLLGTGHFGSVYKGVLGPRSLHVAVKVISLEQEGATKSFMAECKALRNIRHRNLLKIVTACSSTDFRGNDFKALVYEFMPNGNLEQWIHVQDPTMDDQNSHKPSLSLRQRLNIAIDVAYAIDYLHNCCEVPIIHCDLKPSNILLDNDMVAHVGDFGIAKFLSHAGTSNSSSKVVRGTIGYAAPEYGLGSMISKEGDVYSYGILLIEMMIAKKPTDFVSDGGLDLHQYAKSALHEQLSSIIDPRLVDENESESQGYEDENMAGIGRNFECIRSIIEIGVTCSLESPQDRISINDAIRGLQSTRDFLIGGWPQ